jgi:hypothetical protein
MSQAINQSTTSKFHNLSNEMLADAIGNADAVLKSAEAEAKALKDEFKRRGLASAEGEHYAVTVTPQISTRLDTAAVRAHLGADVGRFEKPAITQVVRVRAVHRLSAAA